ncbi:Serine [Trichuris trichiura]|uniref:Serine n=1 Tax=Trichuris trichiura TaxID=36087 RepID=A0A077Z1G6_TRITR|nr:Serine [Trichuris trichiura]
MERPVGGHVVGYTSLLMASPLLSADSKRSRGPDTKPFSGTGVLLFPMYILYRHEERALCLETAVFNDFACLQGVVVKASPFFCGIRLIGSHRRN